MAPAISQGRVHGGVQQEERRRLVRVPFKGGGDAVNSMLTGTTPVAIFGIGNLIQFIRDGTDPRLRGRRRQAFAAAPDIPTFREIGYTSTSDASFFGIYAPTGTPKPIIDKLNAGHRQGRVAIRNSRSAT